MTVTITEEAVDAPESVELVDEFEHEMQVRYGSGGEPMHPISEMDLVAFLVARVDGRAAGCVALRRHDRELAEVKRMYVRQGFRRLGLGAALLRQLVEVARDSGFQVLRLETGLAQPEAIAMYESEGWQPITGFGQYATSGSQRAYELALG
ncbi:MAG: putative GCN5-related N-acetyltransferase [Actinomycetia bacterium]|nr:putative GCN5-related N-acetyltransferase [Actinomycetes bacterium]